ncbi:tRNA uridine-5-carboxymethylaminomethyl(34) synthesis GTPase MnmE [Candidatus Epulonipiscium fishelsonii]|uniref:tRNA uridine-5-carboxymethylaminomethyl(34) synthesis GTPase MnmE n=1 Tax=Candidatus Epulonipiscium fishelsonii TaxID=77094 RepID=A0ACC8XAU0_9FIRM|nr:tRNA uridine-5-carboxymethylaminomethyl(34) synthesis GTPase MnmE [Epulopiscium sp. SCG-B11WGA-EpuloA1]ONI40143.1 tRNA uridine-5-carboxymethylaminomethyl(34) synthesis GTPase MnmE [Epulopiscium sp. SCG-B05WGA-EpuloA1]
MNDLDTIASISTAIGMGAIGIIRVSGDRAIEIVDKIFKMPSKKSLAEMPTHTIHYGHIVDQNNEVIDEVLLMLMKAPRTFTREDVVEINCHGGIVPMELILMNIIKNGARIAERGEFTKRAFLNGRIDLSQVEAVMDIVEAKTELSLKQAINQLEGRLTREIKKYQDELIDIIAKIEVSIDYPEYDDDDILIEDLLGKIKQMRQNLEQLLATSDNGKMIREGVKTAIIGKPNVGKSSLLNILLEENKAIVTNIAGTTRDVVEAYLNIDGIPFVLLDTAGIRETQDIVEQIGIDRSKKCIEEADLILIILDSSDEIDQEDMNLINLTINKNVIYVLNKTDLEFKTCEDDILEYNKASKIVNISTKIPKGIDTLKLEMKNIFKSIEIASNVTISNQRQKESLIKSIQSLDQGISTLEEGLSVDYIAIDLHEAYGHLGMIAGEVLKEEIIDNLFGRFCLGK